MATSFTSESLDNANHSLVKIYALLTKLVVKMAGYWPRSFLHLNEPRPITNHLDRTSLVNKDLLYDQKENFFLAGPMRETPNRQDGFTLPARVANQNTGFASSRPFADQLQITPHWKLFNLKLKKSLKRQKFQFTSKSYSCLI